jgi:hypothetical protein
MYKEAPGQENSGKRDYDEQRTQRHGDRYQDSKIHLDKESLQSVALKLPLEESHRRIGHLHCRDNQEVLKPAS